MFLRTLIVTIPLFILTLFFTFRLTKEDIDHYYKLTQESLELRTKHALEETPAHQKRQMVQKDIWTQNQTRHLQIKSADSDLFISQKKDKIEAIEKLKKIECAIDGEFRLQADIGIYSYPSQKFIAKQNCRLSQNGDSIDSNYIDLNLAEEILNLENPKGHLKSCFIDFEAKKLTWDKKEEKLYLKKEVEILYKDEFRLFADFGTLSFKKLKPELLRLKGNVKIKSHKIEQEDFFALADTLTYDPLTQTILLSSDKRVLIQKENLQISAPQVLIEKDKTIHGLGDVHFAFDLEEQKSFDKLFEKYL